MNEVQNREGKEIKSPSDFADLRQLASEAEKRQADYLEELNKKEVLQTTANTRKEDEKSLENFQADDGGDHQLKNAQEIGYLDRETNDGQKETEESVVKELEIGGSPPREDGEQIEQINGNGDRTVTHETQIDTNRREIDLNKEQDFTGKLNIFLEHI